MKCCILIVFISLLSGSVDAGYVKMTKDNQPKDPDHCLKLEGSKPQVVCSTNFVVQASESKNLTFKVSDACNQHFYIFLGSLKFSTTTDFWKDLFVSRRFSIDSNGQTSGIIKSESSVASPLKFLNSSRYIDVKFSTSSNCAVTLLDSVPVLSEDQVSKGLSLVAIVSISVSCAVIFTGIVGGLIAWKFIVWKNKKAAERKQKEEKDGAKVDQEKKPHSPKETLRIRDDFKKEEKQQSIEQKPSVESDQKSVASPSKEAAAAVKPKKRDETAVKPKTEEVVTRKTQEVSVPDKPVSVVCGVVAAKKPKEPKKKGNKKKKNAAVKTAVEKTTLVDTDKKVVQVKALAEKVTVADTKAKEVEAVKVVVDNKNMVEVASKEPVVLEKRTKETEVKDKREVAPKQVPVQRQAVRQVDVKGQPVVEDIKIVVVEQDKKARTRSADDGYKTELELLYDEGVFTEEHQKKEPGPLSVETETQHTIKKSDDAVELDIKRRRTTSDSCLPTTRQSEVSHDTKRTRATSEELDGRTVLEPFNVYVRPTKLQGGRRPGAFTEEHKRQEAPVQTVEMEARQKRNKRSDDAEELNVKKKQSGLSPCLPSPRRQKSKKRSDDDAAVEERVTPADRARAERRRRNGGEEPREGCCPPKNA